MNTLFDDLQQGLQEAIEYAKGSGPAKVTKYNIEPLKNYSNKEIRQIRINADMTQSLFALYMGVSKKTVEAWENGRNRPSGPACRLLEILSSGDAKQTPFISTVQ